MKKVLGIISLILLCALLLCSCGNSVVGAMVNKDGHLILHLDDGSTLDAGEVGGVEGTQGEKGEQGEVGAAGQQGPQGDKGETGATGATGPKGDKGDDGITPQIRINADNEWEVSTDGGKTWVSTEVKATGEQGEQGETGITPQISIDTITNEWMLSFDEGKTWKSTGVKATGEQGIPGVTPQLRVNADNEWEVSTDGGKTWTSTRVKATGEKGEQGNTGATIKKVEFDAQGRLVITLTDGTVLDPVELPEKEEHQHVFGEWMLSGSGVAVCSGRIYYRVCAECSEIQLRHEPGENHVYENGVCQHCGDKYSLGLEYVSNENGTCYVSGFGTCTDQNVVIPKRSPAGDLVTGIGANAFYNVSTVSSVLIPNSVVSIGSYAFWNCVSLRSVTIPESVTQIGQDVFALCKALNYTVYKNGKYLGNGENPYVCLMGVTNSNVTGFTVAASTRIIAYQAFQNCAALQTVTFEENSRLATVSARAFYQCASLSSITLPGSVVSIGDWAFYNCKSLTSVALPEGVRSIGHSAFSACTKLAEVSIPDSVESIGVNAFEGCELLAHTIYNQGKYLGNQQNPCVYLVEVTDGDITSFAVSDTTKVIGAYAFDGCSGLQSVTITDSVVSIGNWAFNNCVSLASVKIPGSVKSIGYEAFTNCTALETVIFEEVNGWVCMSEQNATTGTVILAVDLVNKSTAASYLKSICSGYYWCRAVA